MSQADADRRFDTAITLSAALTVGGVYVDAWAHNHLSEQIETFFTPWHAVMYAGFLASALTVFGTMLIRRRQGARWQRLLPDGHGPALLGVILYGLGGIGDMIWHVLFGVETGVDSLVSPTHVFIVIGTVLIAMGPFRAAVARKDATMPMTARLALPIAMSIVTLILQFADPFHVDMSGTSIPYLADVWRGKDLAGILIHAGVWMAFLLHAMRRWTLPFGTAALLLGLNTLGMAFMTDEFRLIPAAFIGGLLIDGIAAQLAPGPRRLRELRFFAFLAPVVFYGAYFIILSLDTGIWWSIHMSVGTTFLAGLLGLAMSHAFFPDER